MIKTNTTYLGGKHLKMILFKLHKGKIIYYILNIFLIIIFLKKYIFPLKSFFNKNTLIPNQNKYKIDLIYPIKLWPKNITKLNST